MTVQGLIIGLFLLGAGIFSICGAAFDWDFFIESHKARFFVATFGRNGARVFYGILGTVIAVMGLLMALGLISAERKRKRFGVTESNAEIRSPVASTSFARPICHQIPIVPPRTNFILHPSSFILS
jgi:hypothetical protein